MKPNSHVNGNAPRRVCRHLLEGTTEIPKRCLFDHDCHCCGFDQWLEETGMQGQEIFTPDGEALAA